MKMALLMLVFVFGFNAHADPVEQKLSVQNSFVSYFSNVPLDQMNASITDLVIVVHGSECNAITYFNTLNKATVRLNVANKTLVIAPHFKTPAKPADILPNELTWTDEGWLRGDHAQNSSSVSSFDIIDRFISKLVASALFPNLKTILVTGHSAGGQLTQRYAVASQVENRFPNIHFRYVVANPGSYVYLNAERPSSTAKSGFAIPVAASCAYNDYKYGLDHLNGYFSRFPAQNLVSQYLKRDVTYLLGSNDTDTTDVDQECPAKYQGAYRFKRGLNFKKFLDQDFSGHQHHQVTVPSVGHTEYGMYLSPEGLKVLFPN